MPDGSIAPRGPTRRRPGKALVIGFVNAMPPAAMRSAEWQFRSLIETASRGRPVKMRYFALPGCSAPANDHLPPGHHYEDLERLWDSHVDGLIVTGTEPREAVITDEGCWPAMARLVDWAAEHTISTIWSCFSAHAAVFRLDGITRDALPGKLSGVFSCARHGDHPLLADAPDRWCVPHSRYNGLNEAGLREAGYHILSGSPELGADMFIRPGNSLFVMLQGHPEYGGDTLLREYRRDIMRYLTSQSDRYPNYPVHYLDADTIAVMDALRARALRQPDLGLLSVFDAAIRDAPAPRWRGDSVRLFGRWLRFVDEHVSVTAGQGA